MALNVKIVNIRRGKGKRDKFVYAELIDADTGKLLVSATLEYIVNHFRYATDPNMTIVNCVEILKQIVPIL